MESGSFQTHRSDREALITRRTHRQGASTRLESELARSESERSERERLTLLLERLLESLADGVVALDFRGEVVHLSDALREPSLRANPLSPPLPEAVLSELRERRYEARTDRPVRFELDWEREDTGERRYRVVGASGEGTGEGGAPQLVVFAFHDQTRERTLEAELNQARNLAALGQMAATVAHELRNPLAAIQGFTTLLQRDLPADHTGQRQVEHIQEGVTAANRIISDLLEYCRPLSPRRHAVSPEALISESLLFLQASPRWSTRMTLDLQVDPGLPELAVDRGLLRQVLCNLYDNAIDAMQGAGVLSVRARALGDGAPLERVRIVVRDTGTGLKAEEAARIFEPFYTTKPRGTGLGLAIVRRTIEAHHGNVHVVSAPGKGTSVVLDLPVGGSIRKETQASSTDVARPRESARRAA